MTLLQYPAAPMQTCFSLLPQVSRTFALAIDQLDEPLRSSVCVAYLLCRLVDTFEDATGPTPAEKAAWIDLLRGDVDGGPGESSWHLTFAEEMADAIAAHDQQLLRHLGEVLTAHAQLAPTDRQIIGRCFHEMATGMVEMQELLARHQGELPTLPTMASLHRYCHYVAGTVGFLLTELFFLHSPGIDKARYFALLDRAESFSQALQKINILKDIAADAGDGRCFVPLESLQQHGLTPETLLTPANYRQGLAAVTPILQSVLKHLHRAHEYLELMPVEERRSRLFLAYSLYFGLETIALALREPGRILGHGDPLKISRTDVARVIFTLDEVIDQPAEVSAYYKRLVDGMSVGLHADWPAEVAQSVQAWQATPKVTV